MFLAFQKINPLIMNNEIYWKFKNYKQDLNEIQIKTKFIFFIEKEIFFLINENDFF